MAWKKTAKARPRRRVVRHRKAKPTRVNDGVIHAKLQSSGVLSTNASGEVNGYIALNDPSSGTDWASWTNLYDEYRVTAVKVKFTPYFVSSQTVGGLLAYNVPIFLAQDNDSTGATVSALSVAALLGYDNVKTKQSQKPWTITWRVSKNTVGTGLPIGFQDTTATPTQVGSVGYRSNTSLLVSTAFGYIQYIYYVTFKGKR